MEERNGASGYRQSTGGQWKFRLPGPRQVWAYIGGYTDVHADKKEVRADPWRALSTVDKVMTAVCPNVNSMNLTSNIM